MARRGLQRGALVLVGGLVAGTLGGGAAAQEGLCDPAIPLFEESDLGYRDRGDRCEGIYDKLEVSGSTLSVVSFTEGDVSYDPAEAPLEVTWPLGLDRPVRLRAKPLRPDLFYQMDTVQPATASSFVWPTDFLDTYEIREVAILGWAMVPLGGLELPVHLPLAIRQGEGTAEGGGYNLLVVPGVELSEIYVSIDHVDQGGKVDDTLLERHALEWGYYPADSGVSIPLPDLAEPGIYLVTLIAERLRDGIERPEQFWFYQPAG